MKSRFFLHIKRAAVGIAELGILIALITVGIHGVAYAASSVPPWGVTTRLTSTAVPSPGWMEITPFCEYDAQNGMFHYTYDLTNCTTGDYINYFALTFSKSLQGRLSGFSIPQGWKWDDYLLPEGYKLLWALGSDERYALGTGETLTFGFYSMLQPSNDLVVPVSAKNGYGFGGPTEKTCGPLQPQVSLPPDVPEASTLLLACSGMACIGFIKPKLRRR